MVMSVLVAIFGLAVLMVIHESGHYLAARRFDMRVTQFSIGFGPTLWKHKSKGSDTTFQVAIIPFLAYVRIAGLNPYEDIDPKDPQSYANASLWARIVTIAAGPLANYLFASVFMFFGFLIGGKEVESTMKVSVDPKGPAAMASMQTGDRLVTINGESIGTWEQVIKIVSAHKSDKLDVEIERGTERMHVFPTPNEKGKILIGSYVELQPVTAREAAALSVTEPAIVVYRSLSVIARAITGKEKPELTGPVGIGKELAAAAKAGIHQYLKLLGGLSAALGAFNLLPIPALDGGRLLFLMFEATARRKADAKVEAVIHAIGVLMFLTLLLVVTIKNDLLGLGH